MGTDTTISVILTTDFDAILYVDRLGDDEQCPETEVAYTDTDISDIYLSVYADIGDNIYVISTNLTAGNYSIFVSSDSFGDDSLYCPTPGNYTVTLIDEPIPGVEVTQASVGTTDNQMFDKSTSN